MVVALAGAILILVGIGLTVVQLVVSIRTRECLRDMTGDPWNGRTLEWSMPSPPPAWNFTVLPQVTEIDAWWNTKQALQARQEAAAPARAYQPIEMPKNSPIGFVNAFFAVVTGFALIWHIWWLAAFGLAGAFLALVAFAFRRQEEIELPAAD